jgi:hypothetical protein
VKCFHADCGDATHYVIVIYDMDSRWVNEGTNYADDYACDDHVHPYIASFERQPGVSIIETEVKELPR